MIDGFFYRIPFALFLELCLFVKYLLLLYFSLLLITYLLYWLYTTYPYKYFLLRLDVCSHLRAIEVLINDYLALWR